MASILSEVKNLNKMNTSLAISCGFMGLCCLLAAIARAVVSRTVNSALIKELLLEAIAAAELCACCFELIIGKYYAFVKQSNPIFQINVLIFLTALILFFYCHYSIHIFGALLWLCLVFFFSFTTRQLLSLVCCHCCCCCSI